MDARAAESHPLGAHSADDAGGNHSSSAREVRRLEAELRRREAEVVNLERRLKQSKENLRATELEGEAREKALTALVRGLEERLARNQAKSPSTCREDSDEARSYSPENSSGRAPPAPPAPPATRWALDSSAAAHSTQEWAALVEQLREAARQLSRSSACSDEDVKVILHKVLKDAALNKHKVVELKEDVSRLHATIEALETEKVQARVCVCVCV
jgi:chromosome segregation ATPase